MVIIYVVYKIEFDLTSLGVKDFGELIRKRAAKKGITPGELIKRAIKAHDAKLEACERGRVETVLERRGCAYVPEDGEPIDCI